MSITRKPESLPAMKRINDSARLLVVDDDPLVRLLATESLKAAGFEVDEAADGASALGHIDARRPDLILLDVLMPVMDGYETCRRLRSNPDLAAIPIIMLTGLEDTASIEQAYQSGASDFIAKPINATLLGHRVRYALRASHMLMEISQHRKDLSNAQRIARLGSWSWEAACERFRSSEQYQQVTGLNPDNHWRDIITRIHPEDIIRVTQAMDAAVLHGKPYAMAYRLLTPDSCERNIFEQAEVFLDDSGRITHIVGTTQDITERVATEAQIRQLADYDNLTGLANRRLFNEVIQHGINRCKRSSAIAAVLNINLDRFSRINETLGNAVGDQVLREVARRIVDSIRSSDFAGVTRSSKPTDHLARVSGDGFAVFLCDIARREDAVIVARRLCEAIERPMAFSGHDLALTASIGISVFPDNGESADELFGNADIAMRHAKETATGGACYFTPTMNDQAMARLDMENKLRAALTKNELTLFYQARVDVSTRRIVGAEALVRWQHPQRGLVPPGEFIPVAEECGLIDALTEWVVREACRQLRQWTDAGIRVVPLSVNISAHNIRELCLSELFADSLREFSISPALIEGEITESALMQDVDLAITQLKSLKNMGVELALDDFGTGYSSLAYLKRFPLNVLKIDRSFVKDVLSDPQDAAIAAAILTLGQSMSLSVVAEGMEQVEQANFLLEKGCRYMQGFLFSRPVPADAFATLLCNGLEMPAGLLHLPEQNRMSSPLTTTGRLTAA